MSLQAKLASLFKSIVYQELPKEPGLPVAEIPLPPFGDGLHAFLLVLCRENREERAALEADTLGDGRFLRPVHDFLGYHDEVA